MTKKKRKDADEWKPPPSYRWDSIEAKAIRLLHEVAGRKSAFFAVWRSRVDGSVTFSKEMTPQLLRFADVPGDAAWVTLTYQQACAWEEFFNAVFPRKALRKRMIEGSKAPWYWPPSTEGKLYTQADVIPPMSNEDLDALSSEGQR